MIWSGVESLRGGLLYDFKFERLGLGALSATRTSRRPKLIERLVICNRWTVFACMSFVRLVFLSLALILRIPYLCSNRAPVLVLASPTIW